MAGPPSRLVEAARGADVDAHAIAVALTAGNRATAEDYGIESIEGAPARRCRIALDGATFQAAFPAGPLAGRRRRPVALAWPARLLDLPRRPGRAARGAVPTARRTGIRPEAIQATVDVRI